MNKDKEGTTEKLVRIELDRFEENTEELRRLREDILKAKE